jgi:aminopeptidase N
VRRLYIRSQRGDNANYIGYALGIAVNALAYYETVFGIPYPLPKVDMVALPDFAAGAMENWGLVTYRETALLANVSTSSQSELQRVAVVVAHELAHFW